MLPSFLNRVHEPPPPPQFVAPPPPPPLAPRGEDVLLGVMVSLLRKDTQRWRLPTPRCSCVLRLAELMRNMLQIRHFLTEGVLHRTHAACCPANHPPRTGPLPAHVLSLQSCRHSAGGKGIS
jgi:hypothetical protein